MAEKLVKDPERLVATIEASFPYPDQMERYYGFDIQRFQIAMPQHMAAELVSASEQQAVIEARQKAAQEAGQKIRADVQTFVADCVASLREQTAQLCEDMLSSINGCETGVHQKTLNRLVRFIDQFKTMNFANDTVMEQQLENVKKELLTKTAEEYRDSAVARARLKQGLSNSQIRPSSSPGRMPLNSCSGLGAWAPEVQSGGVRKRTMKANELLKKLGNTLLGKKVNTPAAGGVATVIQPAPK